MFIFHSFIFSKKIPSRIVNEWNLWGFILIILLWQWFRSLKIWFKCKYDFLEIYKCLKKISFLSRANNIRAALTNTKIICVRMNLYLHIIFRIDNKNVYIFYCSSYFFININITIYNIKKNYFDFHRFISITINKTSISTIKPR